MNQTVLPNGVLAAFPALAFNVPFANSAAGRMHTRLAGDNTQPEPAANSRLPKNGHGWHVWDTP